MAQMLGFIYAFFLLLSSWGRYKNQILILQTLAFFFKGLHYYLLGGLSGFLTSLISMLRNLLFTKLKSHYLWTIFFITLYVIIGIFTYQNFGSILPVLATIIYTIIINKNKASLLRWGLFVTSFIWLIYNVYILSYSGIITQIIILISNIIAIIKLDKK